MGMDLAYMEYQLKYDSVHKRFPGTVASKQDGGKDILVVNGEEIRVFREKDPTSIPWGDAGAMYVCESTGIFTEKAKAELHIKGGAKRVIISAPPKDAVPIYVWRESHGVQACRGYGCFECLVHHKLLGALGEGGARKLRHQRGFDDDRTCNDGNAAHSRWPQPRWQGLAWRPLRIAEHHPIFDRCRKSGGQVPASVEREVDRHGIPRAYPGRVSRGPHVYFGQGCQDGRHRGQSHGGVHWGHERRARLDRRRGRLNGLCYMSRVFDR